MLDQHVIASFEELKAVSDPLRSRILAVLSRGAMTTLQVARELGEKPTRLYHHVGILERAGLIRLVREQPKRGTVERYMEPIARVFVIDREMFDPGRAPADAAGNAQLLLDGVLGQTMAELRRLVREGSLPFHDPGRMRMARLHVRGGPRHVARVMAAVEALIGEANRLAEDEEPPRSADAPDEYRLQLAFYPLGGRQGGPADDPPSPTPERSAP